MAKTPHRVKTTSSSSGTGAITLADPPAGGLRSLTTHFGSGSTVVPYVISGPSGSTPTYYERGYGTYNGTTFQLARTNIIASSSGPPVNLPLGTHDVFIFWPNNSLGTNTYSGTTQAIGLDDWGDSFEFTGSSQCTVSLPAIASVPDGWTVLIGNFGTARQIIDPNSTEQIDGVATLNQYPNEQFWVKKNGSSWRTVGRQHGWIPIERQTASASSVLEFTKGFDDTEFVKWRLTFRLKPATDDVYLRFLIGIISGGAGVFHASGYQYGARYIIANAADADSDGSTDTNTANIALTRFVGSAGNGVGNAAAEHVMGFIEFLDPPTLATLDGLFNFDTTYIRSDGVAVAAKGMGRYVGGVNWDKCGLSFHSGNIASGYAVLEALRP